jgi:catechol 2,3-dioxygenase-like lactoylglutathione lyase family enzyme
MKAFYLVVGLVSPMAVRAQSAPPAPPAPVMVAGSFFALSVPDLDASAKWYTEKLGLNVVMQVPRQNKTAVTVLEGGGLIVELIQHDDARPSGDRLLVHGVFKVGVVVEDYAGLLELLRARRVEIALGPFLAREGQRANLIVRDNAGNLLQFFAK